MMLKKIGGIFMLITFLSVPAIAGDGTGLPYGKWWNNAEVASKLNLSDNEMKKLDDVYVNHKRKVIKLRAKIEEEQFELNNLIDSRTINDKAVFGQYKRLEQVRSNLSIERFNFFLDIRKLLGFDRYQQLKSMFQTLRNKRRFEHYRNKMNRRFDGTEKFRPSSYREGGQFKKFGPQRYKDMDPPELTEQPMSDISPVDDGKDLPE